MKINELHKFPLKLSFAAIALGLGYVFVQTPLNFLYNGIFNQDIIINYDFISTIKSSHLLGVILIIPISEELFFRQYIQKGVAENFNPIIAIIISSILFAAVHLPYIGLFYPQDYLDFNTPYIALFGGLSSALLYYKSESLYPSFLFHIFWNLGVTIV